MSLMMRQITSASHADWSFIDEIVELQIKLVSTEKYEVVQLNAHQVVSRRCTYLLANRC